jgi:hypothetical protein
VTGLHPGQIDRRGRVDWLHHHRRRLAGRIPERSSPTTPGVRESGGCCSSALSYKAILNFRCGIAMKS